MLRLGLGIGALVALLDQATKWWILATVMQPPRVIEVTPFFNLVLGWNRGVSFGLFNESDGVGPWPFVVLTAAITVGLVIWLKRTTYAWLGVALGLIIGGAIGNAVDRLRFGAVVDFLDFHLAELHWPAFNVADSAISVGVVMVLVDSLFGRRR
ncbi:MAG: signal peptidase II [Alphaproteobacteria bacterium]